MGTATWFVLASDDALIQTRRGTRPGGPIADVLFSALFLRVLDRRHGTSTCGLVPQVPWDGKRSLDAHNASDRGRISFGDTIFADDLAVCVQGSSAEAVGQEVCLVAGEVFDTFSTHGLTPSMGPTKTAAIIVPVGKGARQARHSLYNQRGGKLTVFREFAGALQLSLVHRYKHLGGVLSHTGVMAAEIAQRLALARVAFREGRRLVFACKRVDLRRRAELFRGRVLSVLLHGAGAWACLLEGEMRDLSAGYVSLCRQLLCIGRSEDPRWTVSQILAAVELPEVGVLLKAERLRFLLQMVRNAPDQAIC